MWYVILAMCLGMPREDSAPWDQPEPQEPPVPHPPVPEEPDRDDTIRMPDDDPLPSERIGETGGVSQP